jgi:hypothetical protein
MKLDIRGVDKAVLLIELYRRAKPLGMGVLAAKLPYMSIEEARVVLACDPCLDYLHGRVMKVDLAGDELDARLYDRDNGEGTAARAIYSARGMTETMAIITREKEAIKAASVPERLMNADSTLNRATTK